MGARFLSLENDLKNMGGVKLDGLCFVGMELEVLHRLFIIFNICK